ncbi:MAG: hypothetical protein KAI28_02240 [Sphingomonadales bacterium]|nr:hypothetical protein [Sphingomonadales bacterium]
MALSATVSALAIGGCENQNNGTGMEAGDMSHPMDKLFPRYTEYDPKVPIWNVTPDLDRCIHRFHLSSPFSPSGRYLGLTRLPREDVPPQAGDVAEIVVVDLVTGEQKIVAETIGWDTQLGAQVQWGASDEELYFNDVDPDTWVPFGVKMDHLSGAKQKLDGTIYDVSPDGKWAVSTSLRRIGATQAGYGVIVPKENVPVNKGLVDDDGVFVTNTETGEVEMIASYKQIVDEALPKIDVSRYGPGDFYGFHVKWNSKSERIMLVLRYMPYNDKQRKPMLITMTRTGDDIRVAIPATEWADKGGNHPDWHPDGEHVIMNLDIDQLYEDKESWMYVQAKYDGTGLKKFTTVPANHGHPSIHPGGRYMISDVYPREADAFGDGTVPLHFVDLEKNQRQTLVRIDAVSKYFDEDMNTGKNTAKEMRVDLHPAWDSSGYTRVAINGVVNGTRRVFVADLSAVLK